ncbi:efflux RND transporter permease subunit [Oceanispirochaeta crateris]|uniref:Efflux RND transporter permease subunit n=1 Tax=Oceanispirochaeta crateris TaxID=2518645 RepID=A0A5C1QI45_9SPIO|nr:efflux RND transporter permease subunit [Oceanispirochaeta crateris]QEN07241.1 efflux RND transporter permease subunit [Oceanispirochaeta crateris]
MNLHLWAQDHPISVLMAWTGMILFGVISFFELPREELPALKVPEIRIAAAFSGFPPEEMEQLVTIPMENALSTVRDIKAMNSVSKAGTSSVSLTFDWKADLSQASVEIRESIDTLYPQLPQGVKKPVVYTSDLSDRPCVTLALIPHGQYKIEELYNLVHNEIRGEFQWLDDVSLVEFKGLRKPVVHIDLDMNSLETMNLTVNECSQALSGYLVSRSIGEISDSGIKRLVKIDTGLSSLQGLKDLHPFPGRGIAISDIASLSLDCQEPTSLFLLDDKPGMGLDLYKKASSGTIQAVDSILNRVTELQKEYEDRLEIVLLEESGTSIKKSFQNLLMTLFWGLAAATAVLFVLYRTAFIPLITSLSIPVTLVFVFFFMHLLKISLNTLSLMGMVVSVGLIADSILSFWKRSISPKEK